MRSKYTYYAKTATTVFIFFWLSSVVGCSSKPEDACLGKWSTDNGSAKIEIFKDGTINIAEKSATDDSYLLVGGKYSITDQNKIVVELYESKTTIIFSVSNDEMTWTYPNGDVLKYRREKVQ